MKNLVWESVEKTWQGGAFPIETYQASLGVGKDGKEYLVRSKYYPPKNSFMITFDNADIGTDSPFLRHSVIHASSYWDAMRKYHRMQYASYAGVMSIIKDFAKEKGIEL